ncbi:MAG: hypothetical protein NDI62_02250 [Burkholderiales bacterium]|nr:hypothetical protein [Burkholderiales bacterium]
MSKINNNLISTFGILTFIFGLFITSPVYASVGSTMYTGVTYFPQNDVVYQNNTNNQGQVSIVGCEGRNTGFSTVSGQSCVGNYINNKNNTSPSNTNTRTITSRTSNNENVSNTTTNKTVAKLTDVSKDFFGTNTNTESTNNTTNENSENTLTKENTFSGVTANALVGSNSFMPTGLLQWIILLIIIVAIMFLWRYVHAEEKYLAEPLKHA